jgi:hypothetical protein
LNPLSKVLLFAIVGTGFAYQLVCAMDYYAVDSEAFIPIKAGKYDRQ